MKLKIKKLVLSITENLVKIIKRFPMSVLASVVSTALVIAKSEIENPETVTALDKPLLCSFMGVFLFTLLQLVSERIGFKGLKRVLLYAAGLAFILLYGVLLPEHLQGSDALRYLMMVSAFFLLLFIVHFTGRGEEGNLNFQRNIWHTGTWYIYATVASGILFIGIAVAYAMVSALFGVDSYQFLLHSLTICFCFVAPMVFLNGLLPYEETFSIKEAEGFLRMVVDYVLIPLVMVYILILAVYFGKTTLAFKLPEGKTAYLVISCSSLGILIYYLVHRFDNGMQKGIERVFTKIFFWCMIPMVILLWIAIIMRLSDYGVTENRYIVVMLAAWISAVTIHGLVIRKKKFITWPAIFAALLILSIFGPWSMFSVSRSSQYSRVTEILNRYGALRDGKLLKASVPLSSEDSNSLYSSIEYLLSNHGGDLVLALMPEGVRTGELAKTDGDSDWQRTVVNAMEEKFNLKTDPQSLKNAVVKNRDFKISQKNGGPAPVEIKGFTYLVTVDWQLTDKITAGSYTVTGGTKNEILKITSKDKQRVSIDLGEYASILRSKCGSATSVNLSSEDMTFSKSENSMKYKIVFSEIRFTVEDGDEINIHSARMYLLL